MMSGNSFKMSPRLTDLCGSVCVCVCGRVNPCPCLVVTHTAVHTQQRAPLRATVAPWTTVTALHCRSIAAVGRSSITPSAASNTRRSKQTVTEQLYSRILALMDRPDVAVTSDPPPDDPGEGLVCDGPN